MIGELLKQLDAERYLVKSSHGPRYVVGCQRKVDPATLKPGTRVTLDVTTFTIMRALPREVDPTIYSMASEDPGKVPYSAVGGLSEQIREMREVIELPLTNPELFKRVGIKPPKGVLLYGPPGTGKTLLARALACNMNATFLKVVASAIVDKYIGESSRVIREMFGYAKDHQPCVIFMDEIDAIGKRPLSRVEERGLRRGGGARLAMRQKCASRHLSLSSLRAQAASAWARAPLRTARSSAR